MMEDATLETSDVAERPAPGTAFLRVTDLWKSFGDFVALRNVSLDIAEGELVCFLGPSGCGKTTLLRAIAGLDLHSSGRIEQAGRDISILPASQRDFGIVFQSYALFPNLTIEKNIAYGLENVGRDRAETARRVAELLTLVGLPEQAKKYPAQLSGGQQQRIALARAIATSPGLLLLDEPLSALDAKVRVSLRHEIKTLQRKLGVTTIMVTHDQEEALAMADRIVVMNHGVIEQIGTPTEIYREPASLFVADFIGEANQLPARVARRRPHRDRHGRSRLRRPRPRRRRRRRHRDPPRGRDTVRDRRPPGRRQHPRRHRRRDGVPRLLLAHPPAQRGARRCRADRRFLDERRAPPVARRGQDHVRRTATRAPARFPTRRPMSHHGNTSLTSVTGVKSMACLWFTRGPTIFGRK